MRVHIRSAAAQIGAILIAISFATSHLASAQEAKAEPTFKTEVLDQMLAPIALYPDDLLSNVLMASTYPLEVVQAARWRKDPTNAKLKGDALTKSLEGQVWDPSVKSLVQFPDVLQTMSEKLEWTQKLGDAFLAQEDDVFDRIQFLRRKAEEAGNLKSTTQQKVSKSPQTNSIIIAPAAPDIVYVPVYQPTVVYGSWWYPSYPPYYWYWGRPASSFVSGFFWGAGFSVANNLWGWGHCDWDRRDIDIDINRYNNINVNRPKITSNTWNHNPAHRGSVPYRDKVSREKFSKTDKFKDAGKDFRGYDKDQARDRVQDKLGDGGAAKIKDKVGDRGDADRIKDKLGEDGASKIKDKVGDRGDADRIKDKVGEDGGQKLKNKVGDKDLGSKVGSKDIKRDIKKPSAKIDAKPAARALDVKPKAQVKAHVDRGSVSRKAAASHPNAGRSHAGGGAKRGGGGGGRRR